MPVLKAGIIMGWLKNFILLLERGGGTFEQ
jgi:hypothetical protein